MVQGIRKLLVALFLLFAQNLCSQCLVQVNLQATGHCTGDTLRVIANDSLQQIHWMKNGELAKTVSRTDAGYKVSTVAGGNGQGTAANQLSQPENVFVDAAGNLYIADYLNSRIQKWAPGAANGVTVVNSTGLPTPYSFCCPAGVVVDSAGAIYMTIGQAEGRPGVEKWTPPGTISFVAGGNGNGYFANQLIYPYDLQFDKKGNLYISDVTNSRVQKFPPNSTTASDAITVAGSPNGEFAEGHGQDSLFHPYGIFVDDSDNLYVADNYNSRVQKYPRGSLHSQTIIGPGHGANQVIYPYDVVIDSKGNLYVSDYGNNRLMVWKRGADSGVVVAGSVMQQNILPFDLAIPAGLAVDKKDAVYLCDALNNRVQKYEPQSSIEKIFVADAPGLYTAIVITGNGCADTLGPIQIDTVFTPAVQIVSSPEQACQGSPVNFIVSLLNTVTNPQYKWEKNGKVIGINEPFFTDSSLQTGDSIRCIVTTEAACSNSGFSNILIAAPLPVPIVSAGRDTAIAASASVQLQATSSLPVSIYNWSPVSGLTDATVARPIASPAATTTYRLTVTATNGCTASASIVIYVDKPLLMPNAFTPNGDGKNDVFRIPPGSVRTIDYLMVYDRWGEMVFKTTNAAEGWDGKLKGEPLPVGSYVWLISYPNVLTGKPIKAKGTVALLR